MADNVLDHAALNTLLENVGGDRVFLAELIDTYFADAPNLFDQINGALASGAAEDFRRAAHSLKSNSANFGATRLAEMAKALEELGKAGQIAGTEGQIAQLAQEYERVRAALEAVRNG
jgi:HPt (histidine-containing phosphotransfer) domain-containing protein